MEEQTIRQPTDESTGGDPPCWQHLFEDDGRLDSAGVRDEDAERMRQYLLGPKVEPPRDPGSE